MSRPRTDWRSAWREPTTEPLVEKLRAFLARAHQAKGGCEEAPNVWAFLLFDLLDELPAEHQEPLRGEVVDRALHAYQAGMRHTEQHRLLPYLTPQERQRYLEIVLQRAHDTMDQRWSQNLTALWPELTEEEQDWIWPQAIAAARVNEVTRSWHLTSLAEIVPVTLRPELLDQVLCAWEGLDEIGSYPSFCLLRPGDAPALHRRLAALIGKARAGMYLPYLWECVTQRAPEGERSWLLEEALRSYETHPLIGFDQDVIPFDGIAPFLDVQMAHRALARVEAHWTEEAAEPSALVLLVRLIELGEPASSLLRVARRLTTEHLRVEAWCLLLPHLPQEARSAAARELWSWLQGRADLPSNTLRGLLSLFPLLAEEERSALLTAVEELTRVRPNLWEREDAAGVVELLLSWGELQRAQHWVGTIPRNSLEAVEARLVLARGCLEDERAAALVAEARTICAGREGWEPWERQSLTGTLTEHADWLPLDWLEAEMIGWLQEMATPVDLVRWLPFLRRRGGAALLVEVARCMLEPPPPGD